MTTYEQRKELETALIAAIKEQLPALEKLLKYDYDDEFYRFYHQSFKVYYYQHATEEIVTALKALAPNCTLNEWFLKIISDGTGKEFQLSDNDHWLESTRPIVEAFFHARKFLELAVKGAKEIDEAPNILPSGWAAFLYLYNLR